MDDHIFHTAVYLRLSREDGDVDFGGKLESNSISNQKELVNDYLKSRPEFDVYGYYIDDGYTGTNFDRPNFQRMLNDIKTGQVDCIIVKDLSRFGRNYIETGRYIEKIFPMLGIRFIAITDNYDSAKDEQSDRTVVAFRNLINDAYCRDISVKVRSFLEVKRKKGDYVGAFAAYGYLKDPENKNHLIVDDYAASVVQDIFRMKEEGMSTFAIADVLNETGILPPARYKRSIGIRIISPEKLNGKSGWTYFTVLRVLKAEVYTGTTVQGKSATPNYKIRKRTAVPKENWVRVEGTHEAIIPREEFDFVQELLLMDTMVQAGETVVPPLSGILFCADCGAAMSRKAVPVNGKTYYYYVCIAHKMDRTVCSGHSIPEKKLYRAVLLALQAHIDEMLTLSDAAKVIEKAPQLKADVLKYDGRIQKIGEEKTTCEGRLKNLYEDHCDGILTKEEYFMLKGQYEKELEELKAAEKKLQAERNSIASNHTLRQDLLDDLEKYKGFQHLDRAMVTRLIRRIDVAEGGRITITFRFAEEKERMQSILAAYSGRKEAV